MTTVSSLRLTTPRRADPPIRAVGWLLGAVLLIPFGWVGATDPPPPRRVMLFVPVEVAAPALRGIVDAVRETIEAGSGRSVVIHLESADFAAFPAEGYQDRLANHLAAKYRELPSGELNLIVAIWEPSYEFFARFRNLLFPQVPLVFAGADPRNLGASERRPLSTGVTLRPDISGTLAAARVLLPAARRLVVVVGASPYEQLDAENIAEIAQAAAGLEVEYLIGEPVPRIHEIVGTLLPDTLVLYTHVFADRFGHTFVPADVLEGIAAISAAPIFGAAETYVGRGIVGGHVYLPSRVGQLTGELALRVLRGESPDTIEPITAPEQWVFDARQMARWGLREADLPPDSDIRFRPTGLLHDYRPYLVLGLVFVVLQTLMIAVLLRERHVRLQSERRALSLGHRLVTAHEDERVALARDLHDNLQQQLAFLAITVGGLRDEIQRAGIESSAPDVVRNRLILLSREVRALAHRLHPPELEELGLAEAVHAECARFSEAVGVPVHVLVDPALAEPSCIVGLALYRVVQEALQNIAKHALARGVVVRLESRGGRLLLEVRDDGQGFYPGPKLPGMSLGLLAMRERLRAIGGVLDVDSAPGEGAAILVSVPLREADNP